MPDPTSSHDDPFADLFGKLPDPSVTHGADRAEPAGSSAAGPVDAVEATSAAPVEEHPLSRRAAREQAERAAAVEAASAPATAPAATASQATVATPSTAPTAVPDVWLTGDDLKARKPRRKRRVGCWVAFAVVIALLGGVAGTGWWVWNAHEDKIREILGWEEPKDFDAGIAHGETYITVNAGDTGQPISQALFDAGVTKTPGVFYDMLIKTRQDPPFQPGVFKLQLQMTAADALTALLDPANRMENTVLLREGLTVQQSLDKLSDGLKIPRADFDAAVADPSAYGVAADSLEGWLFPATYTFNPGVSAHDVIAKLVARTVQSLDAAGVPEADRQRILTIASIIQREARFEADFYKVSRVIENRLDPKNQETFGLLQMDSTAQYGYGEMHDGTVSSSAAALADDNPWNTYIHPGLPIGPISNPGDVAIDAAMHPADGPWLYFVTVNLNTGETVFSTTLAEHQKATQQWISWCKDNPGAGC